MRSLHRFLAILGALSTALLLTSGCRNDVSRGGGPSASPTSSVYSGQALPARVERLSGTPYYRSSAEMAAIAKLDGAPFLLMAPQDPTRALLVVERGSTPADVAGRPSELSDFSGVTETSDATELVKFVKDDIGLELKVNEAGKVVVLMVERPVPGTATPALPGTATPAVPGTATPEARP